jgi:hypothetical protein
MKSWRWALLIFELALFALILVLPQVDLPDFTFHGGTAPIVAKARLSSAPVRAVTALLSISTAPHVLWGEVESTVMAISATCDSRFSQLCKLRC